MIWIGIIIAVALLAYLVIRKAPPPSPVFVSSDDQRMRARLMSPAEQVQFVSDAREVAFQGYDRGSGKARAGGESDRFSHEVGIMDALYCVLANSNAERQSEAVRRRLQMESVPFNILEPELGRSAVAEYLVWRFFPDRADMSVLKDAFRRFVDHIFEKASDEKDGDELIFRMIYSGKYDWQKLAIAEANERGETHG